MVLRNVTDDATSYSSMEISCLKVSSAVVVGSEGEKDRVVEYMQDVCGAAPAKDAPTATMCTDFASGLERVMTPSSAARSTPGSWSAWTRRTPTSATRRSPSAASSRSST